VFFFGVGVWGVFGETRSRGEARGGFFGLRCEEEEKSERHDPSHCEEGGRNQKRNAKR